MSKTNYKKREPGERDNTVSIFKMHQRYRQKIEKSWGDLKLLTSGSVSLGSDSALTNFAENADNQVTLLNNESVSIAVKD